MDNSTDLAGEFIFKAFTPITVIYSVIILIGLIGNITVFYIYVTKMPHERFEQRYFIPVLTFFDILVCIVSFVYFTVQTYRWLTFHSDMLCKWMVFFVIFTMMTSDAILLAIAVHRYRKICRPFGKQMTLKWRRLSVVLVISSGICYSIPSLIVDGVKDFGIEYKGVNITGQGCFIGNKQYHLLQVVYHGILSLIVTANIILTAAMYVPKAVLIFRRYKKRKSSSGSNNQSETSMEMCSLDFHASGQSSHSHSASHSHSVISKQKAVKHNFNVMFLFIIVVYFLAYIPTTVVNILISTTNDYYRHLSTTEYGVSDFFLKFYIFNHVANPFIYAYFDTDFRGGLRKMFKCRS
ncbi:hypothetical protein FSP39_003022 [Pinctada imbricata]|uniref:G-protein coupled receptors family 1 profile domain-containing protein n=1 Tax=Pinctada imbricata TaxID=66713 RepID=A0AA89C2U4_PINIB|nr:hypothetical protein FSP39_003022 [Pinctada imbricata]